MFLLQLLTVHRNTAATGVRVLFTSISTTESNLEIIEYCSGALWRPHIRCHHRPLSDATRLTIKHACAPSNGWTDYIDYIDKSDLTRQLYSAALSVTKQTEETYRCNVIIFSWFSQNCTSISCRRFSSCSSGRVAFLFSFFYMYGSSEDSRDELMTQSSAKNDGRCCSWCRIQLWVELPVRTVLKCAFPLRYLAGVVDRTNSSSSRKSILTNQRNAVPLCKFAPLAVYWFGPGRRAVRRKPSTSELWDLRRAWIVFVRNFNGSTIIDIGCVTTSRKQIEDHLRAKADETAVDSVHRWKNVGCPEKQFGSNLLWLSSRLMSICLEFDFEAFDKRWYCQLYYVADCWLFDLTREQ